MKYDEGLLVGYRYYDTKNVEPLFPFGHGLSYTQFEYSNAKITPGTDKTIATVEGEVKTRAPATVPKSSSSTSTRKTPQSAARKRSSKASAKSPC